MNLNAAEKRIKKLEEALQAWGFVYPDIESMGSTEGLNRLLMAIELYEEVFTTDEQTKGQD